MLDSYAEEVVSIYAKLNPKFCRQNQEQSKTTEKIQHEGEEEHGYR